MTEVNGIVFHFLNPQLYEKFIRELSAEECVKLLKHSSKRLHSLFSGYRLGHRAFSVPAVQQKIKRTCRTDQELRNILCQAWLSAKIPLVYTLFEFFSFTLKGKPASLEWVDQIHELQRNHGHETVVRAIIEALAWTQTSVDDIKIFVSILSAHYQDQDALQRQVNTVMDTCKKDPKYFLDILQTKMEEDQKYIEEVEEKKRNAQDERNAYQSKLDESVAGCERDLRAVREKQAELCTKERAAQSNIETLKKKIGEFQSTLQNINADRGQLEQKQNKIQKKAEYEQKTISQEITNIDEAVSKLESTIKSRKASLENKSAIKERLAEEITRRKEALKEETLSRKTLRKDKYPHYTKKAESTIVELRDRLSRLRSLIGQPEPVRRNEMGFMATPSTLSLLNSLSANKFEPPMEVPEAPDSNSEVEKHVDYWQYQAVWSFDKWDEHAIVQYSLWRSRQLQSQNATVAAELALSGLFHAQHELDQDNVMLLRFLGAMGGADSSYQEHDDYDDPIGNLLTNLLEQWETNSLLAGFLAQLALISPDKLRYIIHITNTRGRVLLKRILARSFTGIIDLDEYDPSHEVAHLITSTLEQREVRLRAASSRWLVQDSVDAIAQNARQDLMASIAQFPNVGQKETSLLCNEIESQISTPLSQAIRHGVPQAFEDLSLRCFRYSNEIVQRKAWVSSVYLWPCIMHLAEEAMEANIQTKRLFRAALEVSTDKQFYPLNVPERTCSVEIVIKNRGNSEAKDLRALIMAAQETEDADIEEAEPTFSSVMPEREVRHRIRIYLKKTVPACVLEYVISWKDTSSMDERSQTGALKLLSQRETDWDNVQNPYSLKSIKDPAKLKGRSDIMNTLRRSLDSMDSYYITGQRRTGKSSVAHVYYKELNTKNNDAAIYLWWGDLGTTELAAICHSICYELAQTLRERTGEDNIVCPSLSEFSRNENFVFSSFFKEVHSRFPNWHLFIIIDDFDELPASFHETEIGDRFFVLLRALLDRDFVALYLVGSERLPEILKRQGERLNLIQRLEIDYLKDSSEIEKIIVEPAKDILEFDKEAIKEIKRLGAGNPYYTTLVCSRLFADMARLKDYYVSRRDVEVSTKAMIEEEVLSTYQHFWKDGVFLPGRLGERQQYHNAKVLISLSRAQLAENNPITKEELLKRDDLQPLGHDDAEYALAGVLDRKVVAEDEDRLMVRVPLFSQWLAGSGARAVEQSFAEAGFDEVPLQVPRALTARELVDVAQDLTYQDKQVNEIQIADWLSQFGGVSNQLLAFKLLKRLREEGYFNQARIFSAFRELHKQIVSIEATERAFARRQERKSTVNVIVSYLDPSGKSGHQCQYHYRRVNRIHSKCAVAPDKLVEHLANIAEKPPIIFADDIVGTGGTLKKGFQALLAKMEQAGLDIGDYRLYVAVVVGTKLGLEAAEAATGGAISIMPWHLTTDRLHAFSGEAEIFADESDRQAAKEMVEGIGKELEPDHPLGRNNGQLLVLFQHGCPNNTLPIFYKSGRTFRGREWRSLFPR